MIYSRYPIVEINQSYPCFRPIRSLFLSPVEMLSYRTKGTATLFRNSPPQADRFDRSDFKDSNETSFLPNFQTQIVKSFHWLGRQNRNPIIIKIHQTPSILGFQALDRDICIAISTTSRLKSIESRPPLHRLIPNEALFFRAAFFRLGCVNAKDSTTMLPPPPPPTFHRSYRISSREQGGQLSLTRPTTNTRGLDNEPCPCPVPRTFLTDLCVKIGGRLTLRNVEIARKETGERNEVETNYRGDETTGAFASDSRYGV